MKYPGACIVKLWDTGRVLRRYHLHNGVWPGVRDAWQPRGNPSQDGGKRGLIQPWKAFPLTKALVLGPIKGPPGEGKSSITNRYPLP